MRLAMCTLKLIDHSLVIAVVVCKCVFGNIQKRCSNYMFETAGKMVSFAKTIDSLI